MTNMNRDMKWIGQVTNLAAPAASPFGETLISTDGVVYRTHGYMNTGLLTLDKAKGEYHAFGVVMENAQVPNIPFRVFGHSSLAGTFWGVGFAVAGLVVQPALPRFVASGKSWDQLLVMRDPAEYPPSAAPWQVVLFAYVPADSGPFVADLSVQNLLTKGDQFNSRVY